jgi:hypothetical protein
VLVVVAYVVIITNDTSENSIICIVDDLIDIYYNVDSYDTILLAIALT